LPTRLPPLEAAYGKSAIKNLKHWKRIHTLAEQSFRDFRDLHLTMLTYQRSEAESDKESAALSRFNCNRHWRWTALRLILPTGLFRLKDAQGEWDVFCVTLVKVVDGQQLDLHSTLQDEATIIFGHRPLPDGWLGQNAMLFYFQRRHHPEHKKSLGAYGACLLDERSLRALAEEMMSMRTAVRSGPRI
jgi:hypothetical protein